MPHLAFAEPAGEEEVEGGRTWKRRVNQGLPLQYDAVEQLGRNRCFEYLRALGEKVTREQWRCTQTLRNMLRAALSAQHGVGPGHSWSPQASTKKQKQTG